VFENPDLANDSETKVVVCIPASTKNKWKKV